MNQPKNNSLIIKILNYLKETSKNLFDLGATVIFDPRELTKGMSLYRDYTLYFPSRKISNLKRSSYFNFKNNKFYLTPKGRVEIIKNIIKEKRIKKLKWDGRWRAIIFDIPETNRRERRFLRNELKWIGFKELQKSIWIFPYDIEKELLVLLKLWEKDFEGDIRFLRIEKMVDEEDLIKYFRIG